jgi:hypothetical protein
MKKNNLIFIVLLSLCLNFADAFSQEVTGVDEPFKLTEDKMDPSRFQKIAVLQILNKITAKTSILEIRSGASEDVGSLSIFVYKCWRAPLEQKPDNRILMQILEKKADGSKPIIFRGWMISSSPSISSLEHPIYDVTAISCKSRN